MSTRRGRSGHGVLTQQRGKSAGGRSVGDVLGSRETRQEISRVKPSWLCGGRPRGHPRLRYRLNAVVWVHSSTCRQLDPRGVIYAPQNRQTCRHRRRLHGRPGMGF